MEANTLAGKAVLVTGGTMGIGLATALAFAREGASVIITHKWGTADEADVREHFTREHLSEPHIARADVAQDADTEALLSELRDRHDHIEAFISNVSVGGIVRTLNDYLPRSLHRSIDYSA